MNKKNLILVALVLCSSVLFSGCGKKKTATVEVKTNKQIAIEMELSNTEKPYIALIPRADGHELTLKVSNISSKITNAEYELIYTAEDQGLEIEKGVNGTQKIDSTSFEKKLLLGTESCTSGCKYKYDEGITGGTLSITFTTDDNKFYKFEAPFNIKNSAEIKKAGYLSIDSEGFKVTGTITSKSDFFIAIKNAAAYSIFSNGTGSGKISTIEPSTVTKSDKNTFVGDYLIQ